MRKSLGGVHTMLTCEVSISRFYSQVYSCCGCALSPGGCMMCAAVRSVCAPPVVCVPPYSTKGGGVSDPLINYHQSHSKFLNIHADYSNENNLTLVSSGGLAAQHSLWGNTRLARIIHPNTLTNATAGLYFN